MLLRARLRAPPPPCLLEAQSADEFAAPPSALRRAAINNDHVEMWAAYAIRGEPPSIMLDDGRAQLRHVVQRRKAFLAAVARLLHAAERQLDAAAGAERVDVNLARADAARHAQRPAAIADQTAAIRP